MLAVNSSAYKISCNPKDIILDDVMHLLKQAHWACSRDPITVLTSLQNSLCFSVFDNDRQIGIARVITDYATFAYICDVIIDEPYRSQRVGKWLITEVMNHPKLLSIDHWRLKTTHAHSFYHQFGFKALSKAEKHLEIYKG